MEQFAERKYNYHDSGIFLRDNIISGPQNAVNLACKQRPVF